MKEDKLKNKLQLSPELKIKLLEGIKSITNQIDSIEKTGKEFEPAIKNRYEINFDSDRFIYTYLENIGLSPREIDELGEEGLLKLIHEYSKSRKDKFDSNSPKQKPDQKTFKWNGIDSQLRKLWEALKGTYIDSKTHYKDFSKVFSGEPLENHNWVIWLTSKADLLKLFELLNGKFIKYENDYLILNLLFWHKIKGKKLMPLKQANQDMRGRSKDNKNTLKLTEIVKSLSL